jgi:co-chaperonin GroES (HSP10)
MEKFNHRILRGKVLVRMEKKEGVSKSGIILLDTQDDYKSIGYIEQTDKKAKVDDIDLIIGAKVNIPPDAGRDVEFGSPDESYRLFNVRDIMYVYE